MKAWSRTRARALSYKHVPKLSMCPLWEELPSRRQLKSNLQKRESSRKRQGQVSQEAKWVHKEAGRFLNHIVIIKPGKTALGIAGALGKVRMEIHAFSDDRESVFVASADYGWVKQ